MAGTWNFTGPVINDIWIVEHFLFSPSIGKVEVGYNSLLEETKEFCKYITLIYLYITIFLLFLLLLIHL